MMNTSTPAQTTNLRGMLGTILCRGIIPLWIAAGAVFKLMEADPRLLPKNTVLAMGHKLGIDLDLYLAALISIEFLAVFIMLFVGRFARTAAVIMLTVFCAILVGELLQGAKDCGCFGANSPSPIVMLIIDGALLIGALLLKPRTHPAERRAAWPAIATVALALVATGITFVKLAPGDPIEQLLDDGELIVIDNGDDSTATSPENGDATSPPPPPPAVVDPYTNLSPAPIRSSEYYSSEEIEAWAGKGWREVGLFSLMKKWPDGLDEGTHYVVFYSRTCDHCEEMFYYDLAAAPALARQVIAIEVPADKANLRGPNAWDMPQTEARTNYQLPLGANYILTTPVTLTITDGVVRCAEEGDYHECMGLGPSDHGHDH